MAAGGGDRRRCWRPSRWRPAGCRWSTATRWSCMGSGSGWRRSTRPRRGRAACWDGKPWPCGRRAAFALADLVGTRDGDLPLARARPLPAAGRDLRGRRHRSRRLAGRAGLGAGLPALRARLRGAGGPGARRPAAACGRASFVPPWALRRGNKRRGVGRELRRGVTSAAAIGGRGRRRRLGRRRPSRLHAGRPRTFIWNLRHAGEVEPVARAQVLPRQDDPGRPGGRVLHPPFDPGLSGAGGGGHRAMPWRPRPAGAGPSWPCSPWRCSTRSSSTRCIAGCCTTGCSTRARSPPRSGSGSTTTTTRTRTTSRCCSVRSTPPCRRSSCSPCRSAGRSAAPPAPAAALATGALIFAGYEFCHCVQHLPFTPRNRWLREIKKHHLAHHFHSEQGNFGITLDIWDRVLGTGYDSPRAVPRSADHPQSRLRRGRARAAIPGSASSRPATTSTPSCAPSGLSAVPETERIERELEHRATHDALSDVPNRVIIRGASWPSTDQQIFDIDALQVVGVKALLRWNA